MSSSEPWCTAGVSRKYVLAQRGREDDYCEGMEEQAVQRKCLECGFLSLRFDPWGSGPQYAEVAVERRVRGALFHVADPQHERYAQPCCLRGAIQFVDELAPSGWSPSKPHIKAEEPLLRILNNERTCSKWSKYVPGMDPGRMLEGLMFEALEEKLENNRQKWELMMAEDYRKWVDHREQIASALEEDRRKRDNRFNWFIAFLTLVGVLAMTPDAAIVRFGGWIYGLVWPPATTSQPSPAPDASSLPSASRPSAPSQPQPQTHPQS